ncbi:MAG: acyl-CoA synthetase [Comamonadaceae bacterium]|nr:MAG: acyl-CoA synthetase [Comamonadaceae bacterium]
MSVHLAQTGGDAPPRAEWARKPERSNMLALRFMAWVSLRMGRTAARVLLRGVAAYFLVFSPAARRAASSWLQRAGGQEGAEPRWRDLFRQFMSFASVVHDRIYLVNDQYGIFDITLHNHELTQEMRAQGRGLMLMGAHMGSFEVLRSLGRQQPGLRVAMAMYRENAQKINDLLAAINPAAELNVVSLGQVDSMLQLHALLDADTIVGMMGDRSLGDEATRTVPFFGVPAAFPLGPFRMAAILRRPVIFMVGLYGGGNRYDIHFEQLADFSDVPAGSRQAHMEAAMDRYAMLLEKYGRMAPHNWFNFYDFWQEGGKPSETASGT